MMFIWSAKQRKFTNISRSIDVLILIRSIRAESTSKTYIKTCNHQKSQKKIPKNKTKRMAASDTSYPNNYKYRNLGPFYYRIMKPFIQSEIL